jgi:UDP-N-acetylglucosamine--N-acetylmuramyl-(pentapeptide) pyrophosphoryl-undecaprenol N-acetylglucosamine transferase
MRVAFCGGGTGGHVYPALAVAAALRKLTEGPEPEMLYIGVRGKPDREIATRAGLSFRDVTAGPMRGGSRLGTARGSVKLAVGLTQSLRILRSFKPDVVFASGGYGSVGVGLAARMLRKKLLLFLPDVEAGMAVKTLAKMANRIAVTVPAAQAQFPGKKTVVTGYPVREAFFTAERTSAREALGLDPLLPTLLVSGASSGASRLNHAVSGWANDFLEIGQLLHLCGQADEPWLRAGIEKLPKELSERYHLYAYLHEEMPLALAAADLAVMRSGASVLGELPASRLPAILVPGEYEGGYDQFANARFMEANEAAVVLPQERIEELHSMVMYLINNETRLTNMRAALGKLARPEAAEELAKLVVEMSGK